MGIDSQLGNKDENADAVVNVILNKLHDKRRWLKYHKKVEIPITLPPNVIHPNWNTKLAMALPKPDCTYTTHVPPEIIR